MNELKLNAVLSHVWDPIATFNTKPCHNLMLTCNESNKKLFQINKYEKLTAIQNAEMKFMYIGVISLKGHPRRLKKPAAPIAIYSTRSQPISPFSGIGIDSGQSPLRLPITLLHLLLLPRPWRISHFVVTVAFEIRLSCSAASAHTAAVAATTTTATAVQLPVFKRSFVVVIFTETTNPNELLRLCDALCGIGTKGRA